MTWYADEDEDGYGDPDNSTLTSNCTPPAGHVTDNTDCNDNDATLTPADNDGDGYSTCSDDCDDTEPTAYPDNREIADDGIDQDCNGSDASCNNPTYESWWVQFGYTYSSCDWGNDGNLSATEGIYSARREQVETYTLPASEVFCEISAPFAESNGGVTDWYAYDDALLMAYNNFVMFTTTNDFIQNLSWYGSGMGKVYDWDDIAGTTMSYGFDPWERGGNTSVLFPDPSATTYGDMEIYMDDDYVNSLNEHAMETGEISLMLVTFGDNDDWSWGWGSDGADCFSQGFGFLMEMYIGD